MGSWNGTCAVTGIPITHGEPIVTVIASENIYGEHHSSLHGYLKLLPLFFYGEYNDYGAVENEHGTQCERIVQIIRNALYEMELGENQYHDIAVKKENFDLTMLTEADHKGRLFVINNIRFGHKEITDKIQVVHLHIRKDVFDEIVQTQRMWMDFSDENAVNYQEIMSSFDDYVKELENDPCFTTLGISSDKRTENPISRIVLYLNDLDSRTDIPGGSVRDVINQIRRSCENDFSVPMARQELYEVIDNIVQLFLVDLFMNKTNRPWVRPSYAGQDMDLRAHRRFANLTLKVIEKIEKEWYEDSGCVYNPETDDYSYENESDD